IRGIHRYHAETRGWGDIGYNVLVDKFGNAWEGRRGGLDKPIIGAHARGVNSTMFGISVLGNFEEADISDAAFDTLSTVIAAKFDHHGITTSGQARTPGGAKLDRIVGHRDVGSTACPGQH